MLCSLHCPCCFIPSIAIATAMFWVFHRGLMMRMSDVTSAVVNLFHFKKESYKTCALVQEQYRVCYRSLACETRGAFRTFFCKIPFDNHFRNLRLRCANCSLYLIMQNVRVASKFSFNNASPLQFCVFIHFR